MRKTTERTRQIAEYDVYETDAGWLAVHREDLTLRFVGPDWYQVYADAYAARVARGQPRPGGRP